MVSFLLINKTRKVSMKRVINLILAAAFSFCATYCIAANTAPAPQVISVPHDTTTPDPNSTRLWNLQDADILSVINEVSLETGKNFVVDPRVTGKISLVSSKPIKPDEVYDIFLSVLELLGYSAIPSGDVVKIVPNMNSGEFATRVATRYSPGKGDEVVVRVIPLDNVAANQVIPVIRPLLPQWSNVSAYTPGNVLILLGRASNIARVAAIIHNIDQTSSNDIDIVPLRQATASQVAIVLNNLQNAARATGDTPQVSIAADERSNSLLLSGNKSARLHMKFLVKQLDTPTTGVQANTQVIYLRYLTAAKVAPILGKIVKNMMGKGESGGDGNASTSDINMTGNTQTTSNKKSGTPENQTNIQAEPSTNSLIITAPPGMMSALNSIIAKLDVRPAQVLIEAIIVEIDQTDLKNLGIQWGALSVNDTPAGTNPVIANNGFTPLGLGSIGIIPSTQINAVLNILQTTTGVNILSTPSVVVLDNQVAMLEVGQNVPEQSGSYATTGNTSTVSPFNTISNTPVTLRLDVNPQINLGNAVRLKIKLKNDTLQNPDNPGLNPVTNTSKIYNSVIISSGDILVLGGLISNNLTDSNEKVPLLGDIPGLGLLFQHKTRKMEKKNLMVFIKTTILHNSDDSTNITYTKYDTMRAKQIAWPVPLTDPDEQKRQNILPSWRNGNQDTQQVARNHAQLPKPFAADD